MAAHKPNRVDAAAEHRQSSERAERVGHPAVPFVRHLDRRWRDNSS